MRIATWNLDQASRSRPIKRQLDKILQINADIIVLTETCPKVDLSGIGYEVLASELNKYGKNYSALWSKWPIEQAIDTYDMQTAICSKVKAPIGTLIIYGTILTYRNDRGPDGKSGMWEEHQKEIAR
jgi:exonuclease III